MPRPPAAAPQGSLPGIIGAVRTATSHCFGRHSQERECSFGGLGHSGGLERSSGELELGPGLRSALGHIALFNSFDPLPFGFSMISFSVTAMRLSVTIRFPSSVSWSPHAPSLAPSFRVIKPLMAERQSTFSALGMAGNEPMPFELECMDPAFALANYF